MQQNQNRFPEEQHQERKERPSTPRMEKLRNAPSALIFVFGLILFFFLFHDFDRQNGTLYYIFFMIWTCGLISLVILFSKRSGNRDSRRDR